MYEYINEIRKYTPPKIKSADLPGIIKKLLEDKLPDISTPEKKHRYLMGKLMEKCRGHIAAKLVNEALWQSISNV